MNLSSFTTELFINQVLLVKKDISHNMFFHFFGVFDDFSFSTKSSIECISVGMKRSNGIPTEIFRLCNNLLEKNFCRPEFNYGIDVCYIVDTYIINKIFPIS